MQMIEKDAYNDNIFYDAESDIVDEFNHKKTFGWPPFHQGRRDHPNDWQIC